MSAFTGDLDIRFSDAGGRLAVLMEPLEWHCDDEASPLVVIVPAGFASDGASVPRFLWWFLPPWGDKATRAAVLHDYITSMLTIGTPVAGCLTRKDCDRQFRLALLALAVAPWRAWLAWAGVRAYSLVLPILPGWLELP